MKAFVWLLKETSTRMTMESTHILSAIYIKMSKNMNKMKLLELLVTNCNKKIRDQKAMRHSSKEMNHSQYLRASQLTKEARTIPMRPRASKKGSKMKWLFQRPVLYKMTSSKVFKKYWEESMGTRAISKTL